MKDCNYRIKLTKIFMYTSPLSVLSLSNFREPLHKKFNFPPVFVVDENWSRVSHVTSLIDVLPRLCASRAEERTLQIWYFKNCIERQWKEVEYHIFWSFVFKRKSVRLLFIFQRENKLKKFICIQSNEKISCKYLSLWLHLFHVKLKCILLHAIQYLKVKIYQDKHIMFI